MIPKILDSVSDSVSNFNIFPKALIISSLISCSYIRVEVKNESSPYLIIKRLTVISSFSNELIDFDDLTSSEICSFLRELLLFVVDN